MGGAIEGAGPAEVGGETETDVERGEGVMSYLAQLIAKEEGYGIPGTLPTRNNNPGDLRHSPHSQHAPGNPDGIGRIDTSEHGWDDLERQLHLFAIRGLTLRQAIAQYAPASENDTLSYLRNLCLGLMADQPVSFILTIPQPKADGEGRAT